MELQKASGDSWGSTNIDKAYMQLFERVIHEGLHGQIRHAMPSGLGADVGQLGGAEGSSEDEDTEGGDDVQLHSLGQLHITVGGKQMRQRWKDDSGDGEDGVVEGGGRSGTRGWRVEGEGGGQLLLVAD